MLKFCFVMISSNSIIFLKNIILLLRSFKKYSRVCSCSVKRPKGKPVIFNVFIIKKNKYFGEGLLRCFSFNGGLFSKFENNEIVSD